MAKLKLTELPSATSRTGSDILYLVQAGASKQISTDTLLANLFTAGEGISIESNGLIVANVEQTVVVQTENTDALPEGNANLYFTNARAVDAFTAGAGIDIDSNGIVSSTITLEDFTTDDLAEGNIFLFFNNTRAVSALTAGNGIHIDANGLISVVGAFLGSNVDGGGLTEGVTQTIDYGSL